MHWELRLRELVQENADNLAAAIALSNIVLCL